MMQCVFRKLWATKYHHRQSFFFYIFFFKIYIINSLIFWNFMHCFSSNFLNEISLWFLQNFFIIIIVIIVSIADSSESVIEELENEIFFTIQLFDSSSMLAERILTLQAKLYQRQPSTKMPPISHTFSHKTLQNLLLAPRKRVLFSLCTHTHTNYAAGSSLLNIYIYIFHSFFIHVCLCVCVRVTNTPREICNL